MRNLVFFLFICSGVLITSCRSDFNFERSTGGLKFSRDTVYLDTVFTNIGSSTYTLKVYNKSNKDISIPTIQLGRGLDSKYRMTVDGMQGTNGKVFNNVEMLANDSLYIFIETTADVEDANPTDFLYTDQIQFDSGSNMQSVELVTLIQDAFFLYPREISPGNYENIMIGDDPVYGFVLDENDPINGNEYEFTNQKPYVIYGLAAVASGKQLNIAAGARIHCHANSGIIVADGGSINVAGTPSTDPVLRENEVIFEGDRLEPGFSNFPGQWFGIWLTPGSTGSFENMTIANATVGLFIQNNVGTVSINNTQIYDSSNFGILAQTGTITGENIVINTAGQACFAGTLGGSYDIKHSTFNNNFSSSQQVAVLLDNFRRIDGVDQIFPLTYASFANCIIFGSNPVELLVNKSDSSSLLDWPSGTIFHKCQVRFNNTANGFTNNPDYAFINDTNEILKNGNPMFHSIPNNDLQISTDSDASADNPNFTGDPAITATVPFDVIGNPRNGIPDLGAYKAVIFED